MRSVLSGLLTDIDDRLNDQALRTLMYEVMSIVNSRPLVINNFADPTCLDPLNTKSFVDSEV